MKEWNLRARIGDIEVMGRVYKGWVWYKVDEERKMKLKVPEEDEKYWWLGLEEFKRYLSLFF